MRFHGQRSLSLVCLLAYLFASVPATISFAWHNHEWPCQTEQHGCSRIPDGSHSGCAEVGLADGNGCPNDSPTAARTAVASGKAGPNSPMPADDGSHSKYPACPGKCHLCSAGTTPHFFDPSLIMQAPGCLGRVAFDTLPSFWQPSPDELIRPPMC